MKLVSAYGSGALFAVGLALSGMTRPEKVVGFLDLAGAWDPSLALVMVGAIGVHWTAHRLVRGRSSPLFDDRFHLPTRRDIDLRLLFGAAIFGVGWGLGGFCPGPGLVSGAAGSTVAIAFVLAMTVGVVLEGAVTTRLMQAPRHATWEREKGRS